ncbi:hypothetical protein WMF18_12070 [Sorangium sp. So ce315]
MDDVLAVHRRQRPGERRGDTQLRLQVEPRRAGERVERDAAEVLHHERRAARDLLQPVGPDHAIDLHVACRLELVPELRHVPLIETLPLQHLDRHRSTVFIALRAVKEGVRRLVHQLNQCEREISDPGLAHGRSMLA